MKSLTTTVFLDILRNRGDEIVSNLGEIPISKLYMLKKGLNDEYQRQQDILINTLQGELDSHVLTWNQKYPDFIIVGYGIDRCYDKNPDKIGLYLNIKDSELIVLEFSPIGQVSIRKNINTASYIWEDFSQEILFNRFFKTPWIREFYDFVITIHDRYN